MRATASRPGEAAFTNAWLDQGGLAQEAFARLYGRAHSQIVLQHDQSESGGPSRWVSQPSLDSRQRLGHRSRDRNGPYPADFGCRDDTQEGDRAASAAHRERPPQRTASIGSTQF